MCHSRDYDKKKNTHSSSSSSTSRMVEDGFVEEVRRRTRDAESLRVQLQWANKKLSDAAAEAGETTRSMAATNARRCVDCGKALCRRDGTASEAAADEEESSATDLLHYGKSENNQSINTLISDPGRAISQES